MTMPMEVRISEPKSAPKREEYIVPPDWAVRLVSENFGKRCARYPLSYLSGFKSYPYDEGEYDMMAPWGMMGETRENYEAQNKRWAREREERERMRVEHGNLKEEQYRFWNGAYSPNSTIATCRWCRHSAYGKDAMREHQNKTQHTLLLRSVYEYARQFKLKKCFACGTRTHAEKWGIPLCNTNPCLNKWRVGSIVDISSTLLLYAKMAFKIGLLDDYLNGDRSEKYNVETSPKQFNWDNARAF